MTLSLHWMRAIDRSSNMPMLHGHYARTRIEGEDIMPPDNDDFDGRLDGDCACRLVSISPLVKHLLS